MWYVCVCVWVYVCVHMCMGMGVCVCSFGQEGFTGNTLIFLLICKVRA